MIFVATRDSYHEKIVSNIQEIKARKGKVIAIDAKSATVQLSDDVTGILKASDVSREKVEDIRNVLTEGDEVEAKIISVDRKNRQVGLSIKAKGMAWTVINCRCYWRAATSSDTQKKVLTLSFSMPMAKSRSPSQASSGKETQSVCSRAPLTSSMSLSGQDTSSFLQRIRSTAG